MKICDYLLINDSLFVTLDFLSKQGVKKQTSYNCIASGKKEGLNNWNTIRHPNFPKLLLINYDTIKLSKIVLKPKIDILKEIKNIQQNEKQELVSDRNAYLKFKLKYLHDTQWKRYIQIYLDEIHDKEKALKYAKTHAVILEIFKLKNEGYLIKDIYPIYREIEGLTFFPGHITSFYRKLGAIKSETDIPKVIIHGLYNNEGNRSILSKKHKAIINKNFRDYRNIDYVEKLKKINKICITNHLNPISVTTLKRYIIIPEVQNLLNPYRYGSDYFRDNIRSYHTREEPENIGDLWALDGTQFNFYYKIGSTTKKATLFAVMDVHSRKIIGYSLSKSENFNALNEALHNAIKLTDILPCEIIYDNHPLITSKKYRKLVEDTSIYHVMWTKSHGRNPGSKGHIEAFFKVFQEKFCKKEYGYIGGNITSKSPNSRPSDEVLKSFKQQNHVRTFEQLQNLLKLLIRVYNQSEKTNGISPNIKYSLSKSINCISIPDYRRIFIFWGQNKIHYEKF